mmetsp:Transcript_11234/g.16837  ORF Transcript_11234/g.16837 Transcript_11234/m.16837 type:complete len:236 (-) Transcript_11234:1316-2023(-)
MGLLLQLLLLLQLDVLQTLLICQFLRQSLIGNHLGLRQTLLGVELGVGQQLGLAFLLLKFHLVALLSLGSRQIPGGIMVLLCASATSTAIIGRIEILRRQGRRRCNSGGGGCHGIPGGSQRSRRRRIVGNHHILVLILISVPKITKVPKIIIIVRFWFQFIGSSILLLRHDLNFLLLAGLWGGGFWGYFSRFGGLGLLLFGFFHVFHDKLPQFPLGGHRQCINLQINLIGVAGVG